MIFGCPDFQGEWRTGELDALIGTVQKVTVRISKLGKMEFFVNDRYKAILPATKGYYPKSHIDIVKNFKVNLKDRDVFEGEIVKITRRNSFVVKLAIDEDPSYIKQNIDL